MNGVRFGTSLAYLTVYVAAVLLGRLAVVPGSGLAMFSTAVGVAALWVLRGTHRDQVTLDLLLLFLGTGMVNLALGRDAITSALFAVAVLGQAVVLRLVVALLEDRSFDGEVLTGIRTGRQLVVLGLGATTSALATSPVAWAAVVVHHDTWTTSAWATWCVRNACGAFVLAAAVLAARSSLEERPLVRGHVPEALAGEPRRHVVLELALAVSLTIASGVVVFSSDQSLPIGFVMLASSAWIGFRFSPLTAGAHVLLFGGLAALCSIQGWGPFGAIADLSTRAIVVELFVAVTALVTLMLTIGVAERSRLLARLRVSEDHARARAEMLAAVTDALTDGLAVVNARGEVIISNPAAHAMAGDSGEDEPDGSSISDPGSHGFYRGDGSPLEPHELPHVRALAGEAVPPTDYLRIDPVTGAVSVLSGTAVPLHLADGDEPLAVLLIHDVTRERAQTRELRAFAGVVAHDLENPLASLMNWAEILDEQLDELSEDASAARGSLVKIYRSADQMQQLIRDLLLLTQASSGSLELGHVSLDEVVDVAAREAVDQATAIKPRIEHGPLGDVRADLTLVRQVLNNLIGNAVKYVAPGVQPVVKITSRREGDRLQVQVTDNGIGIPAAERAKVFDSWYRSEDVRYTYPGSGLGLAITARAVERHGGTITSREGPDGRGSVFTFTLPADPEPHLRIAPEPAEEEQGDGRTTSAEPALRRTGSGTAVS